MYHFAPWAPCTACYDDARGSKCRGVTPKYIISSVTFNWLSESVLGFYGSRKMSEIQYTLCSKVHINPFNRLQLAHLKSKIKNETWFEISASSSIYLNSFWNLSVTSSPSNPFTSMFWCGQRAECKMCTLLMSKRVCRIERAIRITAALLFIL
jgi:hypothetical protein